MILNDVNERLVKLPGSIELTLHLIKEEIRNKKLMQGLNALGFDPSFYAADLSTLILSFVGFTDHSDKLYEWFLHRLDQALEQVGFEAENDQLSEAAVKMYMDLCQTAKEWEAKRA